MTDIHINFTTHGAYDPLRYLEPNGAELRYANKPGNADWVYKRYSPMRTPKGLVLGVWEG
jgi:hypothetical protein